MRAAANVEWLMAERVRLLEERVETLENIFEELARESAMEDEFEMASIEEVDQWAAPNESPEED